MPRERITDIVNLASERLILLDCLDKGLAFQTDVTQIQGRTDFPNNITQNKLGLFRRRQSRKAVIADMELLARFQDKKLNIPSFLEAGPRAELRFDPHDVRAAVVRTGGVAPGLHCVIHSIVKRQALTVDDAENYLAKIVDHIGERVEDEDQRAHNPHAVVVVAEGVGTALGMEASIEGDKVTKTKFVDQFKSRLQAKVVDAHGKDIPVFVNQPRHHIRAVPANAHDRIYCERLGALAVDNALAGYTDCMISQWLTEFVLVPMALVTLGKKSIPINGMFWKQVVSSTGQPLSRAEHVSPSVSAV